MAHGNMGKKKNQSPKVDPISNSVLSPPMYFSGFPYDLYPLLDYLSCTLSSLELV